MRLEENGFQLVEVKNREGESFEAMLRRFTRGVQHEGIISEARRRKAFEPPSVTRKKADGGQAAKESQIDREKRLVAGRWTVAPSCRFLYVASQGG